jgi:hypothetical protein
VEDQGWSSTDRVLGDWTIEMSGNVVCSLHRAEGDEGRMFFGSASKSRLTVSPGLASKPVAMILMIWPQNH